uniref:Uncharacterized protein n=1 Tax=Branchiostoma floridae TaxID=7739 RepID=C3ZS23_BRAFL|eukprot:XP_002588649.1 hypothetical protein BRAFLDRAFT_101560 [Branchiostoma floridae]
MDDTCFHPNAFEHNRILKIKKESPRYSGCHNLDCFLHAVASGVVMASIEKLPSDGLPHGVYQVQMSCRKDLPTPNLIARESPREATERQSTTKCPRHLEVLNKCKDQARNDLDRREDTASTPACSGSIDFNYLSYTSAGQIRGNFEYVKCPTSKSQARKKTEHGALKFKFKPDVKTVYNPAIWTDERLEIKCAEAFENAMNRIDGGDYTEGLRKQWWGPFIDDYDQKTYWLKGDYIQEENPGPPRKKIFNFYFIHPEKLK